MISSVQTEIQNLGIKMECIVYSEVSRNLANFRRMIQSQAVHLIRWWYGWMCVNIKALLCECESACCVCVCSTTHTETRHMSAYLYMNTFHILSFKDYHNFLACFIFNNKALLSSTLFAIIFIWLHFKKFIKLLIPSFVYYCFSFSFFN